MVEIPASLGAIDARWLTASLREAGHDCPDVSAVTYEPMPGVIGALGEIGIFTLSFVSPTSVPSKLVGKCPLDHDAARQYDAIMQYYARESGFYRDLAPKVPMRVPRCWLNIRDGDRTVLLIDHIDGAGGDVLKGTSFATMRRLVGELAVLHGTYWMDESVPQLPWMLDWRTPSFLTGVPLIRQSWSVARAQQPDAIPSDLAELCEATWLADTSVWLEKFEQRPWTFVHGDYELDNMLFDGDGVVVVDWQGCLRSFPGMDLAWLLATSGSDESVARESELLDHYASVLEASGGPAWSREDVIEDLAWTMLYYVPGMTLPILQDYSPMGEQGRRLERRFQSFFEGCVAGAVRWGLVGRV